MRLVIAMVMTLLAATAAAQYRGSFNGPFTGYEAQALSEVWPQIREAARFEDINWRAHGLSAAPGSPEARRLMATNWNDLRRAQRFEDIDWSNYYAARGDGRRTNRGGQYGNRAGQADRFERQFPGPFSGVGPFTRDEAVAMGQLWPEIREAARFEDINWRAHGLARAPGNQDARRLMAANWDEIRRASRFEDIDWDRIVDDRDLRTSREYAGGFGNYSGNPFTPEEAAAMSQVWGQIREAAQFSDINWQALGLSGPPGDREARRVMSANWGQLRTAARFEDIDWAATAGSRSRVLR
jgi:hypothetical protein